MDMITTRVDVLRTDCSGAIHDRSCICAKRLTTDRNNRCRRTASAAGALAIVESMVNLVVRKLGISKDAGRAGRPGRASFDADGVRHLEAPSIQNISSDGENTMPCRTLSAVSKPICRCFAQANF